MLNTHLETYIGVDPGWKNLGLAIVQRNKLSGEISLLKSSVIDVSYFTSINKAVEHIDELLTSMVSSIDSVVIERYVAYNNVYTSEAENINLVIGALLQYFGSRLSWNIEPKLMRAIDWKSSLVKELYRQKGFENPSDSLDKKFSIAAAKCCLTNEVNFETNHEADAVCLAAMPIYIKSSK